VKNRFSFPVLENPVDKIVVFLVAFAAMLAVAAGISVLLAFPVKWCWNYTMPYIFKLPEIGWGHAWCLVFLAGTFFKATVKSGNK
jgi:hypothetical protein